MAKTTETIIVQETRTTEHGGGGHNRPTMTSGELIFGIILTILVISPFAIFIGRVLYADAQHAKNERKKWVVAKKPGTSATIQVMEEDKEKDNWYQRTFKNYVNARGS